MIQRLSNQSVLGLMALAAAVIQAQENNTSKRGLSIHGDTDTQDYALFLSQEAPISWYYSWSVWPSQSLSGSSKDLEFVPLLHGIENLEENLKQLGTLPETTSAHLLTFNEPDGTTDSGGCSIEPADAAQAYIDHILPLRKAQGGRWLISHPSVTGSENGLNWLSEFCAECVNLNGDEGCPTDFVAAHWYGDFSGITWWVDQVHEFYKNTSHSFLSESDSEKLQVWITEMAVPQLDEAATETMINQTLPFLDETEYVGRYAWFGLFRQGSSDADGWAGSSVAMLDGDGALTDVGATYLGGEQNGFSAGEKEGESASLMVRVDTWTMCLGILLASQLW